MAYPPEFSSTKTYANRYDLDEIDVFLEGNPKNPMFFNVNGLPNQLSYGKHYFNLSILEESQQYKLRSSSRILFEFKSINNVVLLSDIASLNQRNGVATCFVEVLKDPLRTMKDIEDGRGTLTIVASLDNNKNTEKRIPNRFLNAMNYRCTFPIEIRKNLLNADSPFITNFDHKIISVQGQFSFAKASISPLKTSEKGLTYNSGTGLPNVKIGDFSSKGGAGS